MKSIPLIKALSGLFILFSTCKAEFPVLSDLPANGRTLLGAEQFGKARSMILNPTIARFVFKQNEQTPSGQVLELNALLSAANGYDAQVGWTAVDDISEGDVVLVRILARATKPQPETGQGVLELTIQNRSTTQWKNWETVPISTEWAVYDIPFRSAATIEAKDLAFTLCFGHTSQTLEVGRVEVLDYGTALKLEDLPHFAVSYQGREPEAAWRQAAAERIDKLRKSDLIIKVIDETGKPVPGAEIQIRETRSAFHFGTAVDAGLLTRQDTDSNQYRKILLTNFNAASFENDLKWVNAESDGRANLPEAFRWLEENHFPIHGHCLIWPGESPQYKFLPDDVLNAAKNGEADLVRERVFNRIEKGISEFKGRIFEWDVVNEAVENRLLQGVLGGDSILIDWYKAAKRADPAARLVLNDYVILSGGAGRPAAQIDRLDGLVKMLLDAGAPIEALGEQAHFQTIPGGIDRMLQLLDRFEKHGLPIVITEFDFATKDDQLQADYIRDFYTAAFSHPAIDGITMWGFWQGAQWKSDAALWRKDWTPRPSAECYQKLVNETWRSNAQLTTDENGQCKMRVFRGQYAVDIFSKGKLQKMELTVGDQALTSEVNFTK